MNRLWESPPDRDLPLGRLAERREHLVNYLKQTEQAAAPVPPNRGHRGVRPRMAGALAALTLGALIVTGGAIWLSGGSGEDVDAATGTISPTDPGSDTQILRGGVTGINTVLAAYPIRTVSGDTKLTANESGESFPYLVLELANTDLHEAYEVLDPETAEPIGIQTVYSQWWSDEAGNTVGRELLLRVQEVGQDYEWLTYLTELADASESVQIGDRDVTIYRIPNEKLKEGTYDLDILYWVEEPGVEAILIPWGLAGDEASGLMAGLQVLGVNEWLALAGSAPDSGAAATTTTIVEGG